VAKKYREVRKILREAGWVQQRVRGSHECWVHPDGRTVILAGGGKANRNVPVGTLAEIRRGTGLEELR
jgi:predicted RNA binding protein YcfA (HicA-like mRNA interferase family)